jgi:nucleoside-diphosphate-sugar epimerase
MTMPEKVLVTGAFGLVGSATVTQLTANGHRVVATDLGVDANRAAAAKLPPGVEVRWADLTDEIAIDAMLRDVSPTAIIHLAAVIPPVIYRNPTLARKVNVDATAALVRAAEKLSTPPRFIHASSNAAYGARNPHRTRDLLTADTPTSAADLYGAHKIAAENHVRSSILDWVVPRLAGVLSVQPQGNYDLDSLYFGGLLPTDGRVHTVDVRDVAAAFCAAVTADVIGETLLIGGDESHHLRQGDVAAALAAAAGLIGALPAGRPGDPDSDHNWFATDWMDTGRAQSALSFQHHSWPDMLAEVRTTAGWKRFPLRLAAPIARILLQRRAPYRNRPGRYADPWGMIRDRWGDPSPDPCD